MKGCVQMLHRECGGSFYLCVHRAVYVLLQLVEEHIVGSISSAITVEEMFRVWQDGADGPFAEWFVFSASQMMIL